MNSTNYETHCTSCSRTLSKCSPQCSQALSGCVLCLEHAKYLVDNLCISVNKYFSIHCQYGSVWFLLEIAQFFASSVLG